MFNTHATNLKYQVTDEYPNGAYFRRTLMGNEEEVSPFASIPVAAYYVVYVLWGMDWDVVHCCRGLVVEWTVLRALVLV